MKNSRSCEKRSEHKRTTAMLIAVAFLFIISEFPQGVMVVISSLDKNIFNNVYIYMADFLDDVVLLNSSANFILYATMSNKFRKTFYSELIRPIKVLTRVGCSRRKNNQQQTVHHDSYKLGQEQPLINLNNTTRK